MDSLRYLKNKKVVTQFQLTAPNQGWDSRVNVSLELSKFYEVLKKLEITYSADKLEQQVSSKALAPEVITEKAKYDVGKGVLYLKGKSVKFKKEGKRAKFIEFLMKDTEAKSKKWEWEEVICAIEGLKEYDDSLPSRKNTFYPTCDGIARAIALKTEVSDFLDFNKTTVQINEKYR